MSCSVIRSRIMAWHASGPSVLASLASGSGGQPATHHDDCTENPNKLPGPGSTLAAVSIIQHLQRIWTVFLASARANLPIPLALSWPLLCTELLLLPHRQRQRNKNSIHNVGHSLSQSSHPLGLKLSSWYTTGISAPCPMGMCHAFSGLSLRTICNCGCTSQCFCNYGQMYGEE